MQSDDFDDPNDPQDIDLDDFDDADDDDTIRCPSCGRSLHSSAALCPACGEWILRDSDSSAHQRSRTWFWPLMIGLLIAIILVFWAGLRL